MCSSSSLNSCYSCCCPPGWCWNPNRSLFSCLHHISLSSSFAFVRFGSFTSRENLLVRTQKKKNGENKSLIFSSWFIAAVAQLPELCNEWMNQRHVYTSTAAAQHRRFLSIACLLSASFCWNTKRRRRKTDQSMCVCVAGWLLCV